MILALCSQNRTYMIVSVTRIYTLVKNGDSGQALLHSPKTPKEQGMQGGEREGSWEEERERGCGVHASWGSSQKATELSRGLGVVSPWGGVSAPLLAGRAKSPSGSQAPGCGWAVSPRINDSAWLGPVKPCALTLSFTAFPCVRECFFLFVFMKVVKSSPCGLSGNGQGQGWHVGSAGLPWGKGKWLWKCPRPCHCGCVSRSSEELLGHAYHLLMAQLSQEHAEIRLSAFQVLGQLFARSHQFRTLVISNFQEFLELTLGTDHERPLPPPREVAQRLRQAATRAVHGWNEKYGAAYKKLALGFHFLKHSKQVGRPCTAPPARAVWAGGGLEPEEQL